MIDLKIQGALTAKQACVIAWWCQKAGAVGEFRIACAPGKQSGKYSRHFDSVTASDGLDDDGIYVIPDLPVYRRADASMSGKDIRAFAPHDAMAEEVATTPSMKFELAKRISDLDLPAVYFNHRLYAETGEALYPMALYVDGVAFSRIDKIVGF